MNPSSQLRRYPSRRAVLGAAVAGAALPMLGGCATGGDDDATRPPRAPRPRRTRSACPTRRRSRWSSSRAATATSTPSTPSRSTSSVTRGATVDHKGIQRSARCCSRGSSPTPRPTSSTTPARAGSTWPRWSRAGKLTDLTELLDAPQPRRPGEEGPRHAAARRRSTTARSTARCRRSTTYIGALGRLVLEVVVRQERLDVPEDVGRRCSRSASEIKKAGVAPWTWQGKYPEYLNDPLVSRWPPRPAAPTWSRRSTTWSRTRGRARRWSAPPTAIDELAGKRLHPVRLARRCRTPRRRTRGARARWRSSRAGRGWRREQKAVTPAGFDMVMAPCPRSPAPTSCPQTALQAASSESFIVPAKAKNARGGLEFLRHPVLHAPRPSGFAELNSTMPSVAGALEGLTLTSGLGVGEDGGRRGRPEHLHLPVPHLVRAAGQGRRRRHR